MVDVDQMEKIYEQLELVKAQRNRLTEEIASQKELLLSLESKFNTLRDSNDELLLKIKSLGQGQKKRIVISKECMK